MAKRKTYKKTSLITPGITSSSRPPDGRAGLLPNAIPPANRFVRFHPNRPDGGQHDFSRWYGIGIDQIVYAIQRQIGRFLDKQDGHLEPTTVMGYCRSGLGHLLDYMALLSVAMQRELTLADINRSTIDGFLGFLRDLGAATPSQRKYYDRSKAVLLALGRRGLINLIGTGETATFPRNPFPGSNQKSKGETPLSMAQRKAFTAAVKTAVQPLLDENAVPTSELLAYALLVIALHTGRNTTPLLEMPRDCLRTHPKNGTQFLAVYKRRGHRTSKVPVRAEAPYKGDESLPSIRPIVVRLIRRVIELTEHLTDEAPAALKDRVWLFRSQGGASAGQVSALMDSTLRSAIRKLVTDYALLDSDGQPLRINVSRLRKTFVNRIYEILDGDIATTAIAAGNSSQVTNVNYLRPGDDAKKNWLFMGTVLVQELLTSMIGATERTPVGQCSDTRKGEFAPRRDGSVCMSFFNCLRCRNYVVTGDDLYRLFSFYWRVLGEQPRMDKLRWKKQFAHIPRLIERDVIELGLAKGIFKLGEVEAARERARRDPHPFWKSDSVIQNLETLS